MKKRFNKAWKLAILLLALISIGCEDKNELPEVIASFTQTIDVKTGTVTFINTSENATSYEWNFGDQTTSKEINPTKIFINGTHTVTLTAKNLAGTTSIFTDKFTIQVKDVIALPITFDDVQTKYEANLLNGASFRIIDNIKLSGVNANASKVGTITNNGKVFEGISFDFESAIHPDNEKIITMDFWSEIPVEVMLRLELGLVEPIESKITHSGNGWEMLTFNLGVDTTNYSRLIIFVDGPETTVGTFYIDNIK